MTRVTRITMNLPRFERRVTVARFPIGRPFDQDFPGVRFSAIVGADTFGCAITVDALVAHYGAKQRQSATPSV